MLNEQDDDAISRRAIVADKILDAANSVMPDGSPPDGVRGAYLAVYGIIAGNMVVELVGTPSSAAKTLRAVNEAVKDDGYNYRVVGPGPMVSDPSPKLGIWMCLPYPVGGLF